VIVLREHDILEGGQVRNHMLLLEHESDVLASEYREFTLLHSACLHAAHLQAARGRPVEAPEHVQQGALARA